MHSNPHIKYIASIDEESANEQRAKKFGQIKNPVGWNNILNCKKFSRISYINLLTF